MCAAASGGCRNVDPGGWRRKGQRHDPPQHGDAAVRTFRSPAETAKGSGMIHPNMATMLGVVTCDANVDVELWRALFKRAAVKSFNQVL